MKQKNRLRLDFQLSTTQERKEFLEQYLASETFANFPPTENELNTMADYLLWGKNEQGKNGKQLGLDLRSKHGTWDESPVDSLEQLLEQPTFSETQLSPLGSTRYTIKKENFSREEALNQCDDPFLRQTLIDLFDRIDKLDMQIELYELAHGRRTKEIRTSLAKKFSEEEVCRMRELVSHWNQYTYLKQRHLLVELRREQYTLRDSFHKTLFSQPTEYYVEDNVFDFDAGIEVLPLGLKHNSLLCAQVFRTWRELVPGQFSQQDEKLVSDLYWQKQTFNKKLQSAPSTSLRYFDFRELEHVYQLLDQLGSLEEIVPEQDASSNLKALLDTLNFYVEQADLTDIHLDILQMKLSKKRNTDIAWDINHKYGKTYTSNYISTIFRQRIIPRINDAAKYHEKVISNIFFPEEFKTCCHCGETMLRDPDNFTRKSRATDGFSSRCKKCEKEARQGGKQTK